MANVERTSRQRRNWLYDMESDRGETKNVAAEHPDIVARLQELAERACVDLGTRSRIARGRTFALPVVSSRKPAVGPNEATNAWSLVVA